jgi:hypothetical protein
MKNLLVIKLHSLIDVITNSSTELFVTSGDKEVKEIESILEEKWKHFSKLYDREEGEELCDILEVKKIDNDNYNYVKEYYGTKVEKDNIIIVGVMDNSIPYEFFDIIESLFNAQRVHLG